MCIAFSIIERVYWYLRVILSSMFVGESSSVSFLKSSFSLYSLWRVFWEWDEWLSLKSSVLLSLPSLHSLLMWLHSMFDLSWSSLFLRIFIVLLSSSSLVLIYPLRFTLLFFSYTNLFQVWYLSCIIFTYLIISLICFIVSLLILYSHWAPSSPWLTSFSIHVAFYTWGHGFLIIGYLGLVSLHFYYVITLAYFTSYVLRPPCSHGIRCHLRQPLLEQVFEIWLIFRYHHAYYYWRHPFNVWIRFSYGYGWPGLHIWWWMIRCRLIYWSTIHLIPYWGIFPFRLRFIDLHGVAWFSSLMRYMSNWWYIVILSWSLMRLMVA